VFVCEDVLCTMAADGSGVQSVTDPSDGADEAPDWSPDGSKIAFHRNTLDDTDIYVLDYDSGGVSLIAGGPRRDGQPRWSPDGTKIAFVSEPAGDPDIYVMNADGNERHPVANGKEEETDPAWSPDGKLIAFARLASDERSVDIFTIRPDGSNARRLVAGFTPAWSPDGKRLAYTNPSRGIALIDLATRSTRSVTAGPNDTEPDWSPDGRKIVFRRGRSGPDSEIYVVNADGTAITRLTNDSEHNVLPDWSP
jgi:TolB protein